MKPFVECHMATSIDGRTLLPRWKPEGAVADGLFDAVYERLDFDAWLVGRETGVEYADANSYPETDKTFPRSDWLPKKDVLTYGVVLDPRGKIAWGLSEIEGDPIVVVMTEQVQDSHIAGLRSDGISYLFAGETEIDLPLLLEKLARGLGIRRLLLQGGGNTNGSFLRAGLIDAVSLLVFPAVDGTPGAPTMFGESDEPSVPARFTLESSNTLDGGAVWLRYGIARDVSSDASGIRNHPEA